MRPTSGIVLLAAAFVLAACGLAGPPAVAGDADDLSVLYVGLDPDEPVPDDLVRYAGEFADRQRELFAERTPAFMAFLKEHFRNVGFVSGGDYEASMSDDFDVTIFDTQPDTIAEIEVDGFPRRLRLPEDFDRPALMIGEVGPFMLGRFGFGYKIDHL